MDDKQLLQGLTLIIVLGISAQWIAWRVRVPAILFLLAFGGLAGPVSQKLLGHKLFDPDKVLGDVIQPLVSMSVAVILFEGGLTLNGSELTHVGKVLGRLVTIGAAASWVVTSIAGIVLLRLPWQLAVLLGAILVVTGPTVVGPLLRHVRPVGKVAAALKWEGIVIDPLGAMLAVLVFDAIRHGHLVSTGTAWDVVVLVAKTAVVGTALGVTAAVLLVLMMRRFLIADYLQNPFTLMLVIATFTGAEAVQSDSGLLAVTVMGIALANQRKVPFKHILEFKESLSVLLVSSLFVLLSSRLDVSQFQRLDWRTSAFIVTLFAIGRPAAVFLSTIGSGFTTREKIFLSAVAPRGIVAAAVAGVFALRLRNAGYPDADRLVPITFVVIVSTVIVYGLSAAPLAKALKLARPGQAGYLIVGGNPLGLAIAGALQEAGQMVVVADTNPRNVAHARAAGLQAVRQNAVSDQMSEAVEGTGIGQMLALTPNEEVNVLSAVHYGRHFGRSCVYQLASAAATKKQAQVSNDLSGRTLFGEGQTFESVSYRLDHGVLKKTRITDKFGIDHFHRLYGASALPLFVHDDSGECVVFTADDPPIPRAGQTIVSIVDATVAATIRENATAMAFPATT